MSLLLTVSSCQCGAFKGEHEKLSLFVWQGYLFYKCQHSTFSEHDYEVHSEHKTTYKLLNMSQNPKEVSFPTLITSWTFNSACSLSSV